MPCTQNLHAIRKLTSLTQSEKILGALACDENGFYLQQKATSLVLHVV